MRSEWLIGCMLAVIPGTKIVAFPVAQSPRTITSQLVSVGTSNSAVLEREVSVQVTNVSLKRALQAIEKNANVHIEYQVELVDAVKTPVTVQAVKLPLSKVLAQTLSGTQLRPVATAADAIALQPSGIVVPTLQGIISGKVVQAKTNEPIQNARVLLDGSTQGVITNSQGEFRIVTAPGEHMVYIRAVGMQRASERVYVKENETVTLDVALEASASVLDEVVVTGTVIATERRAIPTPITVITAQDLEQRGITRVEQLFRGEVPGVLALETGTQTYGDSLGLMVSSQIYARGASAFAPNTRVGKANPLKTYVDGVELLDPAYLGTLDPKSIERIEIITGPQAATMYGSGAMGGVMQIFTKRGTGAQSPEFIANFRFGILENNFSNGRTPLHNHSLGVTGGSGAEFSYSGTLSYNYSGQWQPKLWSRMYGVSIGATHTRGPIVAGGSLMTTTGTNGTGGQAGVVSQTLYYKTKIESGEWSPGEWGPPPSSIQSQRVAKNTSQTIAFNIDYRATSWMQHHMTIGRSNTELELTPEAPQWVSPYDSLFRARSATGSRTTSSYTVTFLSPRSRAITSTVTLGANGSSGTQTDLAGELASPTATSYLSAPSAPRVSRPVDEKSWGMFGSWQLGLFDRLYTTAMVRGEHNPAYGRDHRIDWTPTTGITYSLDYKDLTLKLLASYGRATRAPHPEQKKEIIRINTNYSPSQYVSQLEAPDLTPEYSRGPQGGLELYYGNRGMLTINRYTQTISDLIQDVAVDSVPRILVSNNSPGWHVARQNRNLAKIRNHGWEATASINVGTLTFRGVYSWADSRILALNKSSIGAGNYYPGMSFTGLPTHTGNIMMTYAHHGTTISLKTNYIGAALLNQSAFYTLQQSFYIRLQTYIDRVGSITGMWEKPGYTKSDLILSHRLSSVASLTLNVTNLGNSYGSDVFALTPVLGRQTLLGVSLRTRR